MENQVEIVHPLNSTPKEIKINPDKVLELNQVFGGLQPKDNVNILRISESAEKVIEILSNFSLESFRSVFIIEIESENINSDNIQVIKSKINEKLLAQRVILLKVNTKTFLRVENDEFKEKSFKFNETLIKRSLNSCKLPIEVALKIQNNSRTSEWDFGKILKYEPNVKNIFTFAINSQDDFCIRLLKLFDLELSQEIKDEILYFAIKSRNFEVFLATLNVFDENKISDEKIEEILHLKCGEKTQNIFLSSVEFKNLKVAEFFLKRAKNQLHSYLNEAFKIAIEEEFFEIFSLPKELFPFDAQEILNEIEKFHDLIKAGNFKEVKKFTQKYPKIKLCYGHQEVCALELAIDCKMFEIFSFLRANNFYTDKGSELDKKLKNLSLDEKRKICDENLKYIQDHPDSYIGILLSKCKFDVCSPTTSDVQKMLTELSCDEWLKVLLKRASEADIKIIFDIKHEGINNMIPGESQTSTGYAFYEYNEVYVGKDAGDYQRYGTFVHELSHMIFYLIYENKCLPYCEGDLRREEAWDKVLQNVFEYFKKNRDHIEVIIYFVFANYREKFLQHVELAVRPNHMLGKYLNNKEKIQELKETFKELFDFYENFILFDLQIPNVLQIIKLNNEFGVIEEINKNELELQPSIHCELFNSAHKRIIIASNIPKLALKEIYVEQREFYTNKLHVKAKNILVNPQNFFLKDSIENLFRVSRNATSIERIIIDAKDEENYENVLDFLEVIDDNVLIIIISELKNYQELEGFEKIEKIFVWEDLNDSSKAKILDKKLKFQGNVFKISDFFTKCSVNVLPTLCHDAEILINSKSKVEELKNFVSRTVYRKSREFLVNDSVEFIENKEVVVVSDIAGSGKTTFLQHLQGIFLRKFPNIWTSFVSLRDYVKILLEKSDDTFVEKMIKILNLSEIEAEIFKQKFSKGEVRILFDAFDEISPKCKEETLKLFKLFLALNEGLKNQILITTRTHLEHDLENELNVESFKLKKLNEEDQITYFCSSWENLSSNRNFINSCAIETVRKISEILKNRSNIIGIPLILKIVAKLLRNRIKRNFLKEVEKLKLCEIYKKVIEEFVEILNFRFSDNLVKNASKNSSILQAHEFFTLSYFFDENFANSLGKFHDEVDWSMEEIFRCGILSCDEVKRVFFVHETYAEFLLADLMQNIILNVKNLTMAHIELFKKITKGEKFLVSKMFLEEMFEDFNEKNFQFLRVELSEILIKFLEEFFKFILELKSADNLGEKFYGFCCRSLESILSEIKSFEDSKLIENLLSTIIRALNRLPNSYKKLATFLVHFGNHQKLSLVLLAEIKKFYGEDFYEKFLLNNFLNESLVLEFLIENSEENITREILLHQNLRKETILHFTVENFELFQRTSNSINKHVSKEIQKELIKLKNEEYENILRCSASKNERSLICIFEILKKLFDKQEMRNLMKEKNKNANNFLHIAATHLKRRETLEYFWFEIFEIFDNPKKFYMRKGFLDRNFLHNTIRNDPEIFSSAFYLVEIFCESEEEKKKLILEKNSREENLLTLIVNFASKSSLEFLFDKILEIFGKNEMKNILKTEKGYWGKNLLSLNAENENFDSIQFLWEIYEENLNRQEIFELLNEKSHNKENFLHCAAYEAKSKEIFKFLWLKVENYFDDEDQLIKYIKLKDSDRKNILHTSIRSKNENSFFYIFENICCKFLNFKNFICQRDQNGETFLHLLASFGSLSMLEFSFRKLEENLELREIKSFLKIEGKVQQGKNLNSLQKNIVIFSMNNPDKNAIEYVFGKIYKFLNHEDIITMFSKTSYLGDNCMLFAAQFSKSKEIFEYFWSQFSNVVNEPKRFFGGGRSREDNHVLHTSLLNENDAEIFPFVFNVGETFYNNDEERKKMVLRLNEDLVNLIGVAASNASKSTLKFLFQKVLNFYGETKMKKMLRSDMSFKRSKNILFLNTENKSLDAVEYVWKVVEENLSREEILQLLKEISGKYKNNFLMHAAREVKSKEIFKFLWKKVEKIFDDEEKLKNYVQHKDRSNKNILMNSIYKTNENSFFHIFENIFCKFFNFTHFISESDDNRDNPILWLAHFGSLSMIKFLFKNLEEKLEFEEIKNLMKISRGSFKSNFIHNAVKNHDEKSVILLLNKIEKFLNEDEIKKMLIEPDSIKYLPLHYVVRNGTLKIFEDYVKLHKKLFTSREIEEASEISNFKFNAVEITTLYDLAKRNKYVNNMNELVEKHLIGDEPFEGFNFSTFVHKSIQFDCYNFG